MEEEAANPNTASAAPVNDDVYLLRRAKYVLDRVVSRMREQRDHIRLLEAQMEVVRIFGAISGRQFAPPDGVAMGVHPEWEAEDVARDLGRLIERRDAEAKVAREATPEEEVLAVIEQVMGKPLAAVKVVDDGDTLKIFIRTDDLDHGELTEAIDKAIQAAVDDHENAKKGEGDPAPAEAAPGPGGAVPAEGRGGGGGGGSATSTVAHGAGGDDRYGAADAEFGAPDNPGA